MVGTPQILVVAGFVGRIDVGAVSLVLSLVHTRGEWKFEVFQPGRMILCRHDLESRSAHMRFNYIYYIPLRNLYGTQTCFIDRSDQHPTFALFFPLFLLNLNRSCCLIGSYVRRVLTSLLHRILWFTSIRLGKFQPGALPAARALDSWAFWRGPVESLYLAWTNLYLHDWPSRTYRGSEGTF